MSKNPSPSAPVQRTPVLTANIAFLLFAATNIASAIYAPIQDCDEVFNYWEPTHYLNHGYGLQTWEYSPEYAIRSWTYSGLHSLLIWIGTFPLKSIGFTSKVTEFYFVRIVLALVCAFCERRLYSVISRSINPRVAIFFAMALLFSPGMYHAAPAYLPSTFAMYTTMLGVSSFMDWTRGLKTAQGIMWFALGTTLGWPFAGALVLPFLAEEVVLAVTTGEVFSAIRRFIPGILGSLTALAVQTGIDSFFYRKFTCVPLNIVLYNVFSGGSRGPDIYGVEPWHFYIRNLALNFNIWFFLALLAFPLVILQHVILSQNGVAKQPLLRSLVFTTPFYLWFLIFTAQPHKEERFMYPAYPVLALNAAMSLHIILANIGSSDPRHPFGKIPASLKLAVVSGLLLAAFNVGMLRTIGTFTAYSAPLDVYQPLQKSGVAQPGDTVCLGKEWYRFPSFFSLPHGVHAKFIKSEFSGLLPGEFKKDNSDGLFSGTWAIPSGMNDENKEDVGKYTNLKDCTFLVDSHLPSTQPTALEPNYIADSEHWEKLKCSPFLDASQTGLLGRMLWVPDLPFLPEELRRKWGDYCLLRRKADVKV